jgi:hypothetical protein
VPLRIAEVPRDDRRYEAQADVTALRALLAGIVDYAGLFPPAALDMSTAVANYASYRASDEAWMLGRFVVPVARLDELSAALHALDPSAPAMRVSGLLGTDIDTDLARVREFNDRHVDRATVDVLEGKAPTVDVIERFARATDGFTIYAELPFGSDLDAMVAAARRGGVNAKMRTGGVTCEAFPPTEDVLRFMRACIDARVCFKATAGLHHPVRATYRLTYEETSPTGTMFGFLNVFLAAAFMVHGANDVDAGAILEETDARAFAVTGGAIRWRERSLSERDLREARDHFAAAFGSCSFREPVDELRSMTLL